MLDIVNRRFGSHQPCGEGPSIVGDQEECPSGLQQLQCAAAHGQRIRQMLDRLKTRDEAERFGWKILEAKAKASSFVGSTLDSAKTCESSADPQTGQARRINSDCIAMNERH